MAWWLTACFETAETTFHEEVATAVDKIFSGDGAAAKAEVRKVLEAMGYFAVDLGALDVGGVLASLPFGPLPATNFIKI